MGPGTKMSGYAGLIGTYRYCDCQTQRNEGNHRDCQGCDAEEFSAYNRMPLILQMIHQAYYQRRPAGRTKA
jgi:hypothetical protein